jgi:hypothetical protein
VCFWQLHQVPSSGERRRATWTVAHVKTKTPFNEVLWRSLGNLFNHCLEFYLKTRGFSPKNSFNHSVRELINLHNTRPLSIHPRFSTVQPVLARPRISFEPTKSFSHNDHFRNNASEGLRNLLLRANQDTFAL